MCVYVFNLSLVCCVVALGFGAVMIALTFVAAELGGVLQVGVANPLGHFFLPF